MLLVEVASVVSHRCCKGRKEQTKIVKGCLWCDAKKENQFHDANGKLGSDSSDGKLLAPPMDTAS